MADHLIRKLAREHRASCVLEAHRCLACQDLARFRDAQVARDTMYVPNGDCSLCGADVVPGELHCRDCLASLGHASRLTTRELWDRGGVL
jgi:hypothetical protein